MGYDFEDGRIGGRLGGRGGRRGDRVVRRGLERLGLSNPFWRKVSGGGHERKGRMGAHSWIMVGRKTGRELKATLQLKNIIWTVSLAISNE